MILVLGNGGKTEMRSRYNKKDDEIASKNENFTSNSSDRSSKEQVEVRKGLVVNAKKVNIRQFPSGDPDNIVFVADEGTEFVIKGEVGDYYLIDDNNGNDVYISKHYFEEV